MLRLLSVLVLYLSVAAAAQAADRMPQDVKKFIAQREGCDHFRGEMPDPSEKQRMKEVNRQIEKLCKGTDKRLAQLKKKYVANPKVVQRLDEFEPDIEAVATDDSGR